MPPTVIIVHTSDQQLISEIVDLVTGRTAATLQKIEDQTKSVLAQAQGISTEPPNVKLKGT